MDDGRNNAMRSFFIISPQSVNKSSRSPRRRGLAFICKKRVILAKSKSQGSRHKIAFLFHNYTTFFTKQLPFVWLASLKKESFFTSFQPHLIWQHSISKQSLTLPNDSLVVLHPFPNNGSDSNQTDHCYKTCHIWLVRLYYIPLDRVENYYYDTQV